jgi:hypothetical protein
MFGRIKGVAALALCSCSSDRPRRVFRGRAVCGRRVRWGSKRSGSTWGVRMFGRVKGVAAPALWSFYRRPRQRIVRNGSSGEQGRHLISNTIWLPAFNGNLVAVAHGALIKTPASSMPDHSPRQDASLGVEPIV